MEFFQKLATTGEVDINMRIMSKNGVFTMTVMPGSNFSTNKPYNISGTPAELDEKFFTEVFPGYKVIEGIITNIDEAKKAAEEKAAEDKPAAKKSAGKKPVSKSKPAAKKSKAAKPSPKKEKSPKAEKPGKVEKKQQSKPAPESVIKEGSLFDAPAEPAVIANAETESDIPTESTAE